MADDRDVTGPNPAIDDSHAGTAREKDFGRTDRYENKDEPDFNVRNLGDDTAWDSGRGASIGHGTNAVPRARAADAETPGVKTRDADPDEPSSDINRDE
jgi:hypothetical protein